jgi:hypothetical protein
MRYPNAFDCVNSSLSSCPLTSRVLPLILAAWHRTAARINDAAARACRSPAHWHEAGSYKTLRAAIRTQGAKVGSRHWAHLHVVLQCNIRAGMHKELSITVHDRRNVQAMGAPAISIAPRIQQLQGPLAPLRTQAP